MKHDSGVGLMTSRVKALFGLAPLLAGLGIAAVAHFALPASASAHTLSVNKAKKAVTKAAKREAYRNDFRTGSASDCHRKTDHKVACKAHLEDRYDSSLGAMETCTYDARALYRKRTSKQITVLFSRSYECTYDYSPGGGGPADTTPPETTITQGPAEGSTVYRDPSTIPPYAHVTWDFTASEDAFFECQQTGEWHDQPGWWPCSPSQFRDTWYGDTGMHTFAVRATDYAGNVDPTPAVRTFYVQ